MTEPGPVPDVRLDLEGHRFVVDLDGAVAELVYRREPGRLVLEHTRVPEQFGGRGIGSALVQAAVGQARAERLTVVPWCPFARWWLKQHPAVAESLTIDWTPPPVAA